MGMFDTFIGTVNCPKCGKDIRISHQTKEYDCKLKRFGIGDYIDKADSNYFYELKNWCQDFPVCSCCEEEVKVCAAIRNGRLVSYIAGYEDIADLDIMDIEDEPKIAEVINLIKKRIENQEYLFDNELSFKEEEHQAIINELNDLLEEVRRL